MYRTCSEPLVYLLPNYYACTPSIYPLKGWGMIISKKKIPRGTPLFFENRK